MTEQEFKVFAKRLERVWGAQSPLEVEGGNPIKGFYILPLEEVELQISVTPGLTTNYWLCLLPLNDVLLYYCDEKGLVPMSNPLDLAPPNNLERRQLQEHWLPFFRRGLWLSGLAIEASGHEKAEWTQGFSREELEAWNLKM